MPLCRPCDLVVAENAQFFDTVVMIGMGGVEYHGHTWELGARIWSTRSMGTTTGSCDAVPSSAAISREWKMKRPLTGRVSPG